MSSVIADCELYGRFEVLALTVEEEACVSDVDSAVVWAAGVVVYGDVGLVLEDCGACSSCSECYYDGVAEC